VRVPRRRLLRNKQHREPRARTNVPRPK
jgi:hypothetical protein